MVNRCICDEVKIAALSLGFFRRKSYIIKTPKTQEQNVSGNTKWKHVVVRGGNNKEGIQEVQ